MKLYIARRRLQKSIYKLTSVVLKRPDYFVIDGLLSWIDIVCGLIRLLSLSWLFVYCGFFFLRRRRKRINLITNKFKSISTKTINPARKLVSYDRRSFMFIDSIDLLLYPKLNASAVRRDLRLSEIRDCGSSISIIKQGSCHYSRKNNKIKVSLTNHRNTVAVNIHLWTTRELKAFR